MHFLSCFRCYLLCVFCLLVATGANGKTSSLRRPQQQQISSSAGQIKIPWGFQWGETAAEVEGSLQKAKTVITQRRKIGNRSALVASGFIQYRLQQAVFYFQDDRLNEIELQYGEKNWEASQYQDFFDQTCGNIEAKYGPGRLLAQQKNPPDQDVLASIIGYQWTQISATLQAFLFTAEKGTESFQIVSLHYRGF